MIVVLGGRGFVGTAFREALELRGIDCVSVSRQRCDYYQRDNLIELLSETRASFLINAAGYTGKPNVDACEQNKADCLLGNAVLPAVIRKACEFMSLPWLHVSSGCIYSGTRDDGSGFTEDDAPNFSFRSQPCSFYSGTKALGEECLDGCENVYVHRLRIPFDHSDSSRNYLSKLMRYRRLLDVTNSISQLREFIDACLDGWDMRIPFGTYNITNPGAVTTKQVTEIIEKHLQVEHDFEFFESEDQFMQQVAKTPRSSCVLDSSKILSTGIKLTEAHKALEQTLMRWETDVFQPVTATKSWHAT